MAHGGKREGAGKPKGTKAPHTLEAQEQRKRAIELVNAELEAIFIPQIEKAKKGDTMAFNAVLDRAWGKAPQAITGLDGDALKIIFDTPFKKDDTSNTPQ